VSAPQPPHVSPYPTSGQPSTPAAPYVPPQDPRFAQALQAPRPPGSPALGRVALALALVATVGASIALAIALGAIAAGVGPRLQTIAPTSGLEVLTPVRDWVLVAELAAWAGTALGVWALVQGIVATVRRRGRGPGIAAIVIAAVGPAVAAGAALLGLVVGLSAIAP